MNHDNGVENGPTIATVGLFPGQGLVPQGRETHHKIEERLRNLENTEEILLQIIVGPEDGFWYPQLFIQCSGGLRAFEVGPVGIDRAGSDEDFVP